MTSLALPLESAINVNYDGFSICSLFKKTQNQQQTNFSAHDFNYTSLPPINALINLDHIVAKSLSNFAWLTSYVLTIRLPFGIAAVGAHIYQMTLRSVIIFTVSTNTTFQKHSSTKDLSTEIATVAREPVDEPLRTQLHASLQNTIWQATLTISTANKIAKLDHLGKCFCHKELLHGSLRIK